MSSNFANHRTFFVHFYMPVLRLLEKALQPPFSGSHPAAGQAVFHCKSSLFCAQLTARLAACGG
jgi:hypothetical protein